MLSDKEKNIFERKDMLMLCLNLALPLIEPVAAAPDYRCSLLRCIFYGIYPYIRKLASRPTSPTHISERSLCEIPMAGGAD